jgi:Na+:H+ antiporter, NhaA family
MASASRSGLTLLGATAVALSWANSPWADSYAAIWHLPIGPHDLHFWINDGLMTFFFLVVGLEIRREMHDGALSSVRLATLPLAAALGGVAVPALLYLLAVGADPVLHGGWAVPTATDIAFAVGVLGVLGTRVSPALRILLLALAIIDDIVAILVIALVYSAGIAVTGLLVIAAGVLAVLLLQRLRVASAWAYLLPAAIVWFGALQAGIHPTLAGVALGLLAPVAAARSVETALQPWIGLGVMPLFALANAGVHVGGISFATPATGTLTAAIVLALVLGKPLGIIALSALAVRLRVAALPAGVTWRGVLLVGCLGGIGFTMSIFIATLAFPAAALLESAKFAVLGASGIAATLSLAYGYAALPRRLQRAGAMDHHRHE